jgi:UDP-N-acetylmuramate--alanine ligase
MKLPPLSSFHSVHVIGCCGAGCAPLARILLEKGFRVTGSDLLDNAAAATLRKHGAQIAPAGHRIENLPPEKDGLLVVRTSAAGPDNPEVAEAMRRGLPVLRRGEALAVVADSYKRSVAVSGSHGKTSVSAMLAWLLRELGANPGFMIGGSVTGWESAGAAGDGDLFVTEADESDGTHALLHPHLGIVTNVEDDHAWSLGGFEALEHNFQTFVDQSETLLYCASEETDRLFKGHPHAVRLELADLSDDFLPGFGHFQRLDGMIAVKAATLLGFDPEKAEKTLRNFPGVERRLSVRFNGTATVIEDYAHHPTELRESIRSLRELYLGRPLVVIFQPHRYARLERYFDEFAAELKKADRVFVTPVFAAWTGSGKYTSDDLAAAVGGIALAGSWDEIGTQVGAELKPGDVAAIIGAGDLPKILPSLIAAAKTVS